MGGGFYAICFPKSTRSLEESSTVRLFMSCSFLAWQQKKALPKSMAKKFHRKNA
jgi:hypothetical protein